VVARERGAAAALGGVDPGHRAAYDPRRIGDAPMTGGQGGME